MEVKVKDRVYQVQVQRKKIKHTYLRLNEEGQIIISTSILTPDKMIKQFIDEEQVQIELMLKRFKQRGERRHYYLGEPTTKEVDLDLIKRTYEERLERVYVVMRESIPYPQLKVRAMKSRWGTCNLKTKTITLNKELIKYRVEVIDYVIMHELCHFIYAHHGPLFWKLVRKYIPDYQDLRKELREG